MRRPDRIVISAEGEAVPPFRTLEKWDIVFIRRDGWTLGAPARLESVAYNLWKDEWIGFQREFDASILPMRRYAVPA